MSQKSTETVFASCATKGKSTIKYICLIATTIFSSGLYQEAVAGAWVPSKGEGYGKLGVQNYSADSYFGDNADFDEFKGQSVSYYGELGLGSDLALYGSLLYQDIEQTMVSGESASGKGLADTELGLRYQWQVDPFVLSTSLLVKLPYLYDENDDLPLGNGQEDVEFRVLLGKSVYPYGYVGAEFGYRYRTGAPSDEYRYLLEYGFSANDNLYFRTKLDGTLSANNSDSTTDGSGNLSLGPEFDLGKFELTVGWNLGKNRERKLGRWGVELTYTREVYGDNTLEGDALQLGLTRVF